MRILGLILDPDLIEFDVQELVDALERAGDAEVVLELYGHLFPPTGMSALTSSSSSLPLFRDRAVV